MVKRGRNSLRDGSPADSTITAASTSAPRRSRRVSLSAMSVDPPAAAAKKPKTKRARMSSSKATSLPGLDESDEEEDGDTVTGKRSGKAAVKKAPRKRAPIKGMNALATLSPDLAAAFSFTIPALPTPAESPRTMFVFGNGDSGQHGISTTEEIKLPRLQRWVEEKISGVGAWSGGVVTMECGGMFTLAIDGEGKVWSWGVNDGAALGRATAHDENLELEPGLVQGLQDAEFVAVQLAAGDNAGIAISDRGELRAWGSFRSTEGHTAFGSAPGAPKFQFEPIEFDGFKRHSIVQIAAGNDHFLALTTTGYVFACGRGEQDQLGRKIVARHVDHGLTPERLGLKKIVLIGCGGFHSFAVSSNGTVYAWGLNSFHQLGVETVSGGDDFTIPTPTEVASLHPDNHGGAKVIQIAGGEHHTLFLFNNGEVFVCGRADSSTTGLAENHPEILEIGVRRAEPLARRVARQAELLQELTAAGEMAANEIPDASVRIAAIEIPTPNDYIPLPTLLAFPVPTPAFAASSATGASSSSANEPSKIISISAAGQSNLAVSSVGEVFSWGLGMSGQLGIIDDDGDSLEEVTTPRKVSSKALGGFRVLKATVGGQHSALVAIRGEGSVPSRFLATAPVEEKVVVTNGANGANGVNGTNGTNGADAPIAEEEEGEAMAMEGQGGDVEMA